MKKDHITLPHLLWIRSMGLLQGFSLLFDCLAPGFDILTPDSIVRLAHKYSLVVSTQAVPSTENKLVALDGSQQDTDLVVDQIPGPDSVASCMGEDPLSVEMDLLLKALQQLLDSDGSRHLFAATLPENRKLVIDFLNRFWQDVNDETKCKFLSAFPLATEDRGFPPDAYLNAFKLVVSADISQIHCASFSPEEEMVVFGFLSSLLGTATSFPAIQNCNKIYFLAGLHGNAFFFGKYMVMHLRSRLKNLGYNPRLGGGVKLHPRKTGLLIHENLRSGVDCLSCSSSRNSTWLYDEVVMFAM